MHPNAVLIELALKAAQDPQRGGERLPVTLERLRAVRDNLCADPGCHLRCKAGCRDQSWAA